MPSPEQSRNHTMPAALLDAIEQRDRGIAGARMGGAMRQDDGELASQVAALRDEIAELRRLLAPPSAVILTGPEVLKHFERLGRASKPEARDPEVA